jgi:hypothetical protein
MDGERRLGMNMQSYRVLTSSLGIVFVLLWSYRLMPGARVRKINNITTYGNVQTRGRNPEVIQYLQSG